MMNFQVATLLARSHWEISLGRLLRDFFPSKANHLLVRQHWKMHAFNYYNVLVEGVSNTFILGCFCMGYLSMRKMQEQNSQQKHL